MPNAHTNKSLGNRTTSEYKKSSHRPLSDLLLSMENIASKTRAFFRKPKFLLLGLDRAGKTTILYRLRRGSDAEVITEIPQVGIVVEKLRFRDTFFTARITAWDVGSGGNGSWRCRLAKRNKLYKGTDGVIFVVDSADAERVEEAKDEIHHRIIDEDELRGKPILILCSKQDLPYAKSPSEISKYFALPEDRKWRAVGCAATKGKEGIVEGIAWLEISLQHERDRGCPRRRKFRELRK